MKAALYLLLSTVVLACPGFADDLRIAAVDVGKIFDTWNYSRQAQNKIEKLKQALEKKNNDRVAVISELGMTRGRMLEKFKLDAASMSAAEKETMTREIGNMGREHGVLERNRQNFTFEEQRKLLREESETARMILKRIIETIQVHALEKKYDMVIEMGGHTFQQTPLFLHLEGAEDITGEIIARLNEAGERKPE